MRATVTFPAHVPSTTIDTLLIGRAGRPWRVDGMALLDRRYTLEFIAGQEITGLQQLRSLLEPYGATIQTT